MVSYYLDNRGNSRANTCKGPDFGRVVFIRSNQRQQWPVVSHDNWADRRALGRRRFIQISALSTFDGRIEAYHGGNG